MVDDLPADRTAVLDRCECVSKSRRARAEAAKCPGLDAAVGMSQLEAITRRLRCRACALDALDQPEASRESQDCADLERLVGRVSVDALLARTRSDDDLVVEVAMLGSRVREEGPGEPGPSSDWLT